MTSTALQNAIDAVNALDATDQSDEATALATQKQADDALRAAAVATQKSTDDAALAASQKADADVLAALQASFDAYVKAHPGANPQTGFLFGVEAAGNDDRYTGTQGTPAAVAWSYQGGVKALGRDMGQGCKFFDGGSGVATAVNMRNGSGSKEPNPLYAVQNYNAAQFKTFLDGLTYRCRIGLHQEFGIGLAGGKYTAATLNADYKALNDLLDAHPNGHLVEQVLINAENAERDRATAGLAPWWQQIVVPRRADGSTTWVGADTYITTLGMGVASKAYKSTGDWVTAMRKTRADVHLCVSETAISRSVGFTPAQRAQFYTDAAAFLSSVDPAGMVNVWICDNSKSENAGHDYAIDKAGDLPVAQALAALISS